MRIVAASPTVKGVMFLAVAHSMYRPSAPWGELRLCAYGPESIVTTPNDQRLGD